MFQDGHDGGGGGDVPGLAVFRRGEGVCPAPVSGSLRLLVHGDPPALEVYRAPGEAQDLALAQTGEQGDIERLPAGGPVWRSERLLSALHRMGRAGEPPFSAAYRRLLG